MRFSVQLLAIAATVLSFNATPREAMIPLPAALMSTMLQPAVATIDQEAQEVAASATHPATGTSPIAWVLAGGFLMLVMLRRLGSRTPD